MPEDPVLSANVNGVDPRIDSEQPIWIAILQHQPQQSTPAATEVQNVAALEIPLQMFAIRECQRADESRALRKQSLTTASCPIGLDFVVRHARQKLAQRD